MKRCLAWVMILCLGVSMVCGCGGRKTSSGGNGFDFKPNFNLDDSDDEEKPDETKETEPMGELKSATELVAEAMDSSVTPEEYVTPDSAVYNAIVEQTTLTVLEEDADGCTVTIRYPDVWAPLEELTAKLPAEATQEDVDAILVELEAQVAAGSCEMLEEKFELTLAVDEEGNNYIDWTDEALNAIMGNLYLMK